MSRRLLIATWLLGTAIPLVLAVVLVGCCALPFHGIVHRFMPLCHMAEAALTAHQHGSQHGHEQPAAPPSQKQDGQDGPRIAWKGEPRAWGVSPLATGSAFQLSQDVAHRSQLSPGALRCDDDVGTRLALLDTLRI
jgi:hypothetical protein